jgi:hypothetical protein
MAGPLLQILIRLKPKKYHRLQIAARYRIIDLLQQIANDLHLTIDQLLHISIYRKGPNGCTLLYPLNNTHFDVLDKYGLSSNEELFIDLTDLRLYQDEEDKDESTNKTTDSSTTSKFGQLLRYPVPSDNSCLFTSIDFVLHHGKLDLTSNKYLRNLVAKKIESDQGTYSEAILGRTNSEYCKWIRRGMTKIFELFFENYCCR